MKIFLTSDTHFFHHNVIEYCNRPYSCVDEMNARLIENWNKVVSNQDRVYHLGDFSFGKREQTQAILDQLNGEKNIVLGNHDSKSTKKLIGWTGVWKTHQIVYNGVSIFMSHYPLQPIGGLMLHGHTHGNKHRIQETMPRRVDVGVDCWNYTPVELDYLIDTYFRGKK